VIGLLAVTAAGRTAAARLAAAWPDETRSYSGPVSSVLPVAWHECEALVCFLATGATVRLVAPLLAGKAQDPAVVCVDEAGRFAVSLLGGHGGGANALAERVAAVLGASPVVTTATDAVGVPGLDSLGWRVEGDVAAVTGAMLDGEPVRLEAEATWPLPALPPNVSAHAPAGSPRLLITDRLLPADPAGPPAPPTVVLRPRSLTVGVGASRGVTADEVLRLVDAALAVAALHPACVARVATVDAKADEPGIIEAARQRGWPVVTYPARRLALVEVPNPSAAPLAAVGTPSVAEAAALAEGGELLMPKRTVATIGIGPPDVSAGGEAPMATVAIARPPARGRLALVGLGPGARDLLTPRAVDELRRASVVVGLDQYLDQVRDLLRPGTRVLATGLGHEEARARSAVDEARAGHAVALVGSGDAGVYAMASPAMEVAGTDIDVVAVPGVTASLAAAALLGAPLGHDHASVSLSDLHTPWEAIEARLAAIGEGDLVVSLYNPRSRGRDWQLPAALALLGKHRRPDTPVGVVREATRPSQQVRITTLEELHRDPSVVDMLSVVIVGSSNTRLVAGRMVTPRGYTWMPR